MSDIVSEDSVIEQVLEYQFDAAPEKLWRAVTIPEYREQWLPADTLVSPEPISSVPEKEVRYRMQDNEPPYLESEVRFLISPDGEGGSRLTIQHILTDGRLNPLDSPAANDDLIVSMKAA